MRQILACLIVIAGCGKSDSKPVPERSVPAPATPSAPTTVAPTPATPSADSGSCTVTASGAYTGTATGAGDLGSVGSKYWSPGAAPNGMHAPALLLNCHASADLHLTIASKRDEAVPFGPKTYKVVDGDPDIGLMARAGSGILKLVGTIDITAFDHHHVAGTFDVTGPLIKGGGAVTLKGTFDYPCHASGC
ncbi:MAG TPA: hypothetical protein VGL61_33455 [Kofleriaceae bacterium]|jgi:hypothetical protein